MMQGVMALAGLALIWRIPEHYEPHPNPRRRLSMPKQLIIPGIAIGFVNIHYPVVAGFLILHMAQTGGSGTTAFSAYALMVLTSRFFFGGLPDRIPPIYTFYGGVASMATGLALIALVPGPVTSFAGAILLGLGFAFLWSSIGTTVLSVRRATNAALQSDGSEPSWTASSARDRSPREPSPTVSATRRHSCLLWSV